MSEDVKEGCLWLFRTVQSLNINLKMLDLWLLNTMHYLNIKLQIVHSNLLYSMSVAVQQGAVSKHKTTNVALVPWCILCGRRRGLSALVGHKPAKHIRAWSSVHPDLAATMGSVWSFGEHCKNGINYVFSYLLWYMEL